MALIISPFAATSWSAGTPRRSDASRTQRFARRGAGLCQIAVIEIGGMRLAARRVALVGRECRVAIDQIDAFERHAKLFGDQLRLRGHDALAEFFFAGVCGDAAVGCDRDPGIKLVRRRRARGNALHDLAVSAYSSSRPSPNTLKPTISAPDCFRKSRRENPERFSAAVASGVICGVLLQRFASRGLARMLAKFSSRRPLSVALDGSQHAHVREAAAENAGHGALNLLVAGIGIFVDEGLGRHDDGVQAKTALRRLLVDESLLNRVRLVDGAEAIERGDFVSRDGFDRRDAGANRLTFHDHGAGAALAEAAAKFRSAKIQIVAQGVEQRSRRIKIQRVAGAVNFDRNGAHTSKVGRKREGVKRRSGRTRYLEGCLRSSSTTACLWQRVP